ncbi:MAG: hypothetical protein HY658_02425 [Actinobacteria bacterium]|nr:hypothetical protein [Actinomycetota bacterium]
MITSPRNRKVAQAVRLKKGALRDGDGRFLVEGAQGVAEALDSPRGIEVLFHTDRDRLDPIVGRAREAGVEVIHVSEPVMGVLTSTVTPQGLVAVAPMLDVPLADLPAEPGLVALLYAVRDPGNAGTVLRSADAAGADAVVFCGSSVDVYNPKTVRASAGSVFHLPVVREPSGEAAVAAMRDRGLRVLATAGSGREDLYDLDLSAPTAFLFGNEAWGLPDEIAALADATVRVPLGGRAESLNLAAAATVCLFEAARQRRPGREGGARLEDLISAAAHDIRSPLTAVKGFVTTLRRRWADLAEEQRSHMLEAIAHDAERLNVVVKLLVDAARLSGGGLELHPEPVDVRPLVEGVAASAERGTSGLDVGWEGGDVRAVVDPERIRLVVGAMLEAAVWWAEEGPVAVRGRVGEGALEIEMDRAGAAVEPGEVEALFGARSPGSGRGTKMGMYVARGIARAAGGDVTAEVRGGALHLLARVPVG